MIETFMQALPPGITRVAARLLQMAVMLIPGPNVLLVTQLAASDRTRSAAFAALGLTVAAGIWATSAMLGINVLFHASAALRLALQIAGGLYLLYVASSLWGSGIAAASRGQTAPVPALAAFRLGFLTNITNPKSALFFGGVFASAFPPQPDLQSQRCQPHGVGGDWRTRIGTAGGLAAGSANLSRSAFM